MARHFFYGTLRHPPLLAAVAGHAVETRPALLPGHAVIAAAGGPWPMIVARPGAAAEGLLAEGLTAEEAARLDWYESAFGYAPAELPLADRGGAGDGVAHVYLPPSGADASGPPWDLAAWEARFGPAAVAAADAIMARRGVVPAAALGRRYGQILAHAASGLRAAAGVPLGLRAPHGPHDVAVSERIERHAGFFALEEWRLRHRRFDGAMSHELRREALISTDATVVLPYDPRRDLVLLVEQFRMGALVRGDANPWLIEAIAGRIDGGEDPAEAALREAMEEAGIALSRLIPLPGHYPSPGAKTEFLYTYIAIADLPDAPTEPPPALGVEGEDIRTHIVPFARLMAAVEGGEGVAGPLVIAALWLERMRPALRAEAGVA